MSNLEQSITSSWQSEFQDEFNSPYFISLKKFLDSEQNKVLVYPPKSLIFNAFNRTGFNDVKVVILGQDPYHGVGQAHGLAFSVPFGVKIPPSLKNIYKELNADMAINIPSHGNLEKWADQGVLLINATLTVRASQAGSHQSRGWETFTDSVIKKLSDKREGLVFLLWGKYAQAKECLINADKHTILKAAHPSPLSAYNGFFGCKHFSKTNAILKQQGLPEINWAIGEGGIFG